MFNTITVRTIKFIKAEADRVLNAADAQIEYLKGEVVESTNFEDIMANVKKIENLLEEVESFKGDIPNDNWVDSDIIRHIPDFVRSADRVLELCK